VSRECSSNGKKRNAKRLLLGKTEDSTKETKMDLEVIDLGGTDWIDLVQNSGK
jgi:hypothetical protein